MGEVYKATDTRLDRIVAIKVLPSHVVGCGLILDLRRSRLLTHDPARLLVGVHTDTESPSLLTNGQVRDFRELGRREPERSPSEACALAASAHQARLGSFDEARSLELAKGRQDMELQTCRRSASNLNSRSYRLPQRRVTIAILLVNGGG